MPTRVERVNFSRSRDGRVEVNEYHASREILEIKIRSVVEKMRKVNLLNIAKGQLAIQ